MRLHAAGTTRGDVCIAITFFKTSLKILPRIEDALGVFDDVRNSACFSLQRKSLARVNKPRNTYTVAKEIKRITPCDV
jgi:hypothetical protein